MPTIHSCSLIERCLTFRRTGRLTRPVNGALWLQVRYRRREVLISSGEETDMLRLFVSASIFVMVLGLAGLPARAQSLSDATSKSLRVAQTGGAEGSEISGLPKAGERTKNQRFRTKGVLEGLPKEIGGLYRANAYRDPRLA